MRCDRGIRCVSGSRAASRNPGDQPGNRTDLGRRAAWRKVVALLAVALAGACADESSTGLPQQLLGCAFGEGLELPPGGRFSADGTHTFCVSAPEGGSFALVPFVASARDTLLKVGLVVKAEDSPLRGT